MVIAIHGPDFEYSAIALVYRMLWMYNELSHETQLTMCEVSKLRFENAISYVIYCRKHYEYSYK